MACPWGSGQTREVTGSENAVFLSEKSNFPPSFQTVFKQTPKMADFLSGRKGASGRTGFPCETMGLPAWAAKDYGRRSPESSRLEMGFWVSRELHGGPQLGPKPRN